MLEELVHHGEHHGVGHGLGLETGSGREAQEDTGGQGIEDYSCRQKIPPHFTYHHGKFL